MRQIFKPKYIFIFLGLVILILLFRGKSSGSVKNVRVKKVNIESRIVNKTVSSSGLVTSEFKADLGFPSSQRILKIYVEKDEIVEKGDLLAQLDTAAQSNTVQYYKDARDVVLAQRELFERNHESNKDTLGGEEQYKIKLKELNELVAQAEAQYKAQYALINNSYLYAPFSGTIIDVLKEEGETITSAETLIKMADLNTIIFEIDVDQEDYGLISLGMSGEIILDSYPDKVFKAKVTKLPMYAENTDNPVFKLELTFDDSNEIKPLLGMTGEVKIITSSTNNSVDSLYYDEIYLDEENKPYVWVIDNGFISKYSIETGLEGDVYTELKKRPDKEIIVPLTSDLDIKDGYKAMLVK